MAGTRGLTAAMDTELSAASVKLGFLLEIELSASFVRLWTGTEDLSFDSKTWIGAGGLLSIQPIQEGEDVTAKGITFVLTGIDPAFISAALSTRRQNKPVTCYLVFLDSSETIIVDPYIAFKGRVNEFMIEEGPETATITLVAESVLIDLKKARIRRYTHEDQQIDFPGDNGFKFVKEIQHWSGAWGQKT